MSKIAFIYPGQGAQAVGMGKDFYEKSPLSRTIFDQASEAVNLDLTKLCFEENDLLDKTEYTQVAMVTACLAMTRAVESMGLHADMTAGLSLGEYCAIAVAGGMCDLDAIRTVRSRGIFMEHAAPEGSGAMSAVLGMDASVIENVLNGREGVSIANYNCPGQIVITGEAAAVAEAGTALKEAGARRVLPLKVSGPFHSPMMRPAGEELVSILESYDLHCMGMAENGFRQLTNSVRPVHSVEDMKNLKLRVAGSNLLMKCYELWGADATNMNWSETYTALQQGTVDGQENPLPAIDAASVQEVQKYVSLWNANYDCLFFCINQDIYDNLTPEQQAVVDECGKLAVQYEREINRAGDDEILSRWQSKNGVEVVDNDELDIDSFKAIVEPVTEWYIGELQRQGYDDAEELVAAFK
mgnify:CR=1 FL=1